jgi:hypothetical protein
MSFCRSNLIAVAVGAACCAQAQTPQPTTPIEHVVVIFQENVSFDHYFATYPVAANNSSSEPAFTAVANTPDVNGLSGGLLTNNPNAHQPIRLTRAQAVTCDQDHNYNDEQKAFNGGLMNKFVESVGSSSASCDVAGYGNNVVMGYYDGNTVTALWNYARNYAMSDNSFSTQFGPSAVGAINLISGQTHGATVTAGNASGNVGSGGSLIGDPRPDPSLDDCTLAPPRTYVSDQRVRGQRRHGGRGDHLTERSTSSRTRSSTNDRQECGRSAECEKPGVGMVPGRIQADVDEQWSRGLRRTSCGACR